MTGTLVAELMRYTHDAESSPAMATPRFFNGHETARMHALDGVPLASFTSRAVAFVLDFLICFALFLAIIIPGGSLALRHGWITGDVHLEFNFHHWYSLILLVVYFSLSNYVGNGRTIGKRMMRIRAVSLVHDHLSLWHSVERALGYGASFLEGGFGFLQYFIHPNRRTVHDRIAETIVVSERKPLPPRVGVYCVAQDHTPRL
jgi:uncharacterized RDD family membrane protein YckC